MRIEENKIAIEVMDEAAKLKPTGMYEEMVTFHLGVIATMLADISKSLTVIADEAESEDNK